MRRRVAEIIAERSNRPLEIVMKDIDRDHFMSPEEAVEYGLVDGIVQRADGIGKPERVLRVAPPRLAGMVPARGRQASSPSCTTTSGRPDGRSPRPARTATRRHSSSARVRDLRRARA